VRKEKVSKYRKKGNRRRKENAKIAKVEKENENDFSEKGIALENRPKLTTVKTRVFVDHCFKSHLYTMRHFMENPERLAR
jgi:hypothetical protein